MPGSVGEVPGNRHFYPTSRPWTGASASRQSHSGSWAPSEPEATKLTAMPDEPSTPEICDRPEYTRRPCWLFLPGEIIATAVAHLTSTYRATPVYRADDVNRAGTVAL